MGKKKKNTHVYTDANQRAYEKIQRLEREKRHKQVIYEKLLAQYRQMQAEAESQPRPLNDVDNSDVDKYVQDKLTETNRETYPDISYNPSEIGNV